MYSRALTCLPCGCGSVFWKFGSLLYDRIDLCGPLVQLQMLILHFLGDVTCLALAFLIVHEGIKLVEVASFQLTSDQSWFCLQLANYNSVFRL